MALSMQQAAEEAARRSAAEVLELTQGLAAARASVTRLEDAKALLGSELDTPRQELKAASTELVLANAKYE
jgi:hypothetical protein